MTRLRVRFTVRTLAIFVTLICAYFGAWDATKRYGVVAAIEAHSFAAINVGEIPKPTSREGVSSPAPLLIRCEDYEYPNYCPVRYYVWLFGVINVKLPWPFIWDAPGLP